MNFAQAQAIGLGAAVSQLTPRYGPSLGYGTRPLSESGYAPPYAPPYVSAYEAAYSNGCGYPYGPRMVAGFVAPTVIYEQMRQIDQDASRLDSNMVYVADQGFVETWGKWFTNWRVFFDKYQTSNAAKLGAIFSTEELAKQTEGYRQQLDSFYKDYARQRQPNGQPVPSLAPPVQQAFRPGEPTPSGGKPPSGSLLPWWGWMILGVAGVGLVYFGVRQYQKAQTLKTTLRREVLPSLIGKKLAKASEKAGDAADAESGNGRESLLSEYAGGPDEADAAIRLLYRPYEHPHLVPEEYDDGYEEPSPTLEETPAASDYLRRHARDLTVRRGRSGALFDEELPDFVDE